MEKFKFLLKSRKFWAAVIALVFLFIDAYYPEFPFAEDQVLQFVVVIVGYILGTALEDGLAARG